MLRTLRIQNFKAWKDTGEIRLAPLTVFFGTNSAGKSSIPQLLLMLKQTVESDDVHNPLQLGDPSKAVDLGIFEDIIHAHSKKEPVEFSIEWGINGTDNVLEDTLKNEKYPYDRLRLTSHIKAVSDKDGHLQPVVDWFQYQVFNTDTMTMAFKNAMKTGSGKGKPEYEITCDNYDLKRIQGRVWPLPAPLKYYGFPDEVTKYFQNYLPLRDLVFNHEKRMKSIFYLGPLRDYPRRSYNWSGERIKDVGIKGDHAIEALLASGGRKYDFGKNQRKQTMQQIVAERLISMKLVSEIKIEQAGQNRKEYDVFVKTGAGMPFVKLTDVGFGISQILPVIVESFYVPHESVVVIEQPEIHLHPRVQADMADVFIDAIKARENNQPRNCQFLVESHSEYLLRRLQLRIAEEKLTQNDVAIYFISNTAENAVIEELQLDEFGNISNWPEDFFGDEMGDLVKRSEAEEKRMHGKVMES